MTRDRRLVVDLETVNGPRRARKATPKPTNPSNISTQVDGSGTAAAKVIVTGP
jgi:hypothetical protein